MSPALRRMLACSAVVVCAAPVQAVDISSGNFGYEPVAIGAGARALGMGGAFSAVADDATACTWNPAGLAQCERPEFAASLGWHGTTIANGTGSRTEQALRPEHLSVMWPFFTGGCQQVLGLAWQRQFDFTRRLDVSSSALDATPFFSIAVDDAHHISRAGAFSSLGLSYAIEASPGLAFGITVNQWADRWTGSSRYRENDTFHGVTTFTGFGPISTITADSTTRQDTRVVSGTSLVLGSWWQCTPELTLALVIKPGFRLGLESSSRTDLVEVDSLGGTTTSHQSIAIDSSLHHPPSATLGLAWRHADLHTLSFDTTCTRWRLYYSDDDSGRHSPISVFIPPEDFRDLWSFRAGYEYVATLPRCVLVPRVGALVESLPAASVASSELTVERVTATSNLWLGATAGLSLCQRQTIWDLGVQVRRGDNVGSGQFTDFNQSANMTIVTVRAGITVQF